MPAVCRWRWSRRAPIVMTARSWSRRWWVCRSSDRCHQGSRSTSTGGTRRLIDGLGIAGVIAKKGPPPANQVGDRWVVERTQSWMNGFGKLRRCTERSGLVVDFYLSLAAAFVVVRRLIEEARQTFRWPDRPTTRRLK